MSEKKRRKWTATVSAGTDAATLRRRPQLPGAVGARMVQVG